MPDKIVIKNALLISGSTRFGDSSTARHQITGSSFFKGDVEVSGTLTTNELKVNVVNQQITNISATGSTSFGDSSDDTHQFVGRVGLGLSNPDGTLHLKANIPELYFEDQDCMPSHASRRAIAKIQSSAGNLEICADERNEVGPDTQGTGNNTYIAFQIDNVERMRMTHDGRMGVGLTNPDVPLHVKANVPEFRLEDADAGGYAGIQASGGDLELYADDSSAMANSKIVFQVDNTERLRVTHDGLVGVTASVMPGTDNTYDLGSRDQRWANIYTGDLHLKNDRGDWTVIEEEEYLSIRNNKTGKMYKMVLEEIKD